MSITEHDTEFNRGIVSYVRTQVAAFLRVEESDIGMRDVSGTLLVYARTDKPWRPKIQELESFMSRTMPAWTNPHIYFLPASSTDELGKVVALRVYAAIAANFRDIPDECLTPSAIAAYTAAKELNVTDAERAAFALGGAQAVVDLILGEQRERQPVQRALPA